MATRRPELTLGDRLTLSREHAGIGVGKMADMLRVSRHTVTGWEKDRHRPNPATLDRWAEMTDVDVRWLEWGYDDHSTNLSEETLRLLSLIEKAKALAPGERLELSTNGLTIPLPRCA